MKSCGMSAIKYILFIFNFFFAVSGLGVLIAGSVVLADVGEFGHFIEGRVMAPPIVLIIAGTLVFLVASLGCYGAIKESPPLLMAFALCLGIIFIIELAVGIAAAAFRTDLEMALKQSLDKSIQRSSNEDIMAWDHVQKSLMCCGVSGPYDWSESSKNKTVRPSCCRPEFIDSDTKDCRLAGPLFQHKYYQEGCLMKLQTRIEGNASILIGVGIGIAFVQVIGIILACWLASAIRKENDK